MNVVNFLFNRMNFGIRMVKMTLDRTDFEILRLLMENARILNKQLSQAVGLAPSSCHERVKRLWNDGIITGTNVTVDNAKLGYGLTALIFISITKDGQIAIDKLLDDLIAEPEIQSVHLITGGFDLVIRVIVKDTNHLKNLAYEALTGRPEITSYETSIVYESRHQTSVPVPM